MQKSSILAGLVAVSVIAITTVVNLKIKSEYSKGKIRQSMPMKPLPSFKYIKNNLKPFYRTTDGNINVKQGNKNEIGIIESDKERITYRVANDTLFIEQLPNDKSEFLDVLINISVTSLRGVSTGNNKMLLERIKADSLEITATNVAMVSLNNVHINAIDAAAKDKSMVQIEETDTVPSIYLKLDGTANFTANNVIIKNKQILLTGNTAAISLTGRSLEDFGISNIRRIK